MLPLLSAADVPGVAAEDLIFFGDSDCDLNDDLGSDHSDSSGATMDTSAALPHYSFRPDAPTGKSSSSRRDTSIRVEGGELREYNAGSEPNRGRDNPVRPGFKASAQNRAIQGSK